MVSWQDGKLTEWPVDKMTSWQNDELTKWPVKKLHKYKQVEKIQSRKVPSWQSAEFKNDRLRQWQVDIMTGQHNDKLTEWHVYKMTN
jgi:hypothetical protein